MTTKKPMLDSNKAPEDNLQMSIFSGMCESEKYAPHLHPDEALAVTSACSGRGRLNVVTCQDEGIDEDLREIGGLTMSDVQLNVSGSGLPDFIPIIPRGMFRYSPSVIPSGIVGVMINDILTKPIRSKHDHYRMPDGTAINQDVLKNSVFQGKKVVLFSVGPDILIETLWWERSETNFFKTISDMGFFAVTGMNFSLISGECPCGHALNIKKSICFCRGLDSLGVWTIPHIYAVNRFQRERWRVWLLENPTIRAVTINSQLQRKQKRGMQDVFETAQFLLENTAVEIIIHGRARGPLCELRKQYSTRLHFAASGPLKNALIQKGKTPLEYINLFRLSLELPPI
jgi:hypothetical protein